MAVPGWVGTAALLLLLALTTRCNDEPAEVIPPATIPQNPPTSFGVAYKVAYNGEQIGVWWVGLKYPSLHVQDKSCALGGAVGVCSASG